VVSFRLNLPSYYVPGFYKIGFYQLESTKQSILHTDGLSAIEASMACSGVPANDQEF